MWFLCWSPWAGEEEANQNIYTTKCALFFELKLGQHPSPSIWARRHCLPDFFLSWGQMMRLLGCRGGGRQLPWPPSVGSGAAVAVTALPMSPRVPGWSLPCPWEVAVTHLLRLGERLLGSLCCWLSSHSPSPCSESSTHGAFLLVWELCRDLRAGVESRQSSVCVPPAWALSNGTCVMQTQRSGSVSAGGRKAPSQHLLSSPGTLPWGCVLFPVAGTWCSAAAGLEMRCCWWKLWDNVRVALLVCATGT